jgi:hypothetical protein
VGTWKAFGAAAILGAGLWLAGCKSAPELTATEAQSLIQARYDQSPAVPVTIRIDDLGMQQGVTAKYWDRSKAYPNKFWADFKLSDAGKKAVKLANGGDTIEWRPDSTEDKSFSLLVTSVATNHLKARDVKDPQDDGANKTVSFNEAVSFDGLPAPLVAIAHNPGNKLSTHRTATFTLDGGAWKLQSVD